jgi:serine protease inhibitor
MPVTLMRIVVVGVALLAAGCKSSTDSGGAAQPLITALPRVLSSDEQLAATATTEFGLALFRSVNATTARDSNLAVSPISASLALGMLMNGAEGETLEQVRRTLGFGRRDLSQVNAAYKALIPLLTTLDPSVKMSFANAAWFDLRSPPSLGFSQRLSDVFGARVSTASLVAPSTPTTINQWVSDATNARITKMVDAFASDDIAYLINATYFKGRWRSQFSPAQTRPATFRVSPTTTLQVPTMTTGQGLVRVGGLADGTRVGELPFGGDAFVMTIVMPPLGRLEAAIDSLTPARWQSVLTALPATSFTDIVTLPKFRLETRRELGEALASLGMPRAFVDAQLAPMFSTVTPQVAVSSVLQRVFVDVNEEGAEAAAATGITIRAVSAAPGFVVDRPFIFAIRERLSGTVLFVGKVVRPAAP